MNPKDLLKNHPNFEENCRKHSTKYLTNWWLEYCTKRSKWNENENIAIKENKFWYLLGNVKGINNISLNFSLLPNVQCSINYDMENQYFVS